MKKKNFIILLLMPFIFALFGILTLNLTFNLIDNDILAITWEYEDSIAFSVSQKEIELKAKAVTDNNYPLQQGNSLIWKIENVDKEKSEEKILAKFKDDNNKGETIYLIPQGNEGEIKVTCSNEKGNIFRSMNIIFYDKSAIVINPKNKSSQNNIDPNIYYGEYDLVNGKKEKSYVEYSVEVYPKDYEYASSIIVKNKSSNINLSRFNDGLKVSFLDGGVASFTLGYDDVSYGNAVTKTFNIVSDGVNVYNYDDLLYCTNKSEKGEIVVLRKSFESLQNTYVLDENGKLVLENDKPQLKEDNITLFGTIGEYKESPLGKYYKYNFENEVYEFETTYNHEYIKKWNEFANSNQNDNYNPIRDKVYVGLRVQKDFYGNGYTINFHNLTFPYSYSLLENGSYLIPVLSDDNLFRGPLPFYSLGNPNGAELIAAFGQDNIGLYVDGKNITVNDVNLKNCDFGNMLSNLDYTGTVLDISGENITVKNSRLSNGKNVARSFSSSGVRFENCLLSNSRNFLLSIGNNEYVKIDGTKEYEFYKLNGNTDIMSIDDFLEADQAKLKGNGDAILNEYLFKGYPNEEDRKTVHNALDSIQNALDQRSEITDSDGNIIYKGDVTIKDCYFYQSGIASIAMESYFNGPFLYNQKPSFVSTVFKGMSISDSKIIPAGLDITDISGTSFPTILKIEGKTAFYDYKVTETIDLTGLIREKISSFVNSAGFNGEGINIDKIFPLKTYLVKTAKELGYTYDHNDNGETKPYLNIPIAYYGGALNLSKVEFNDAEVKDYITDAFDVELLDEYLKLGNATGAIDANYMSSLMLKCVNIVTGYHPFKFMCYKGGGHDFDKTPNVNQLIENAKGAASEENK